ncbi:MAG: NADH-quinone oxidoreductase subunit C [bacterium]
MLYNVTDITIEGVLHSAQDMEIQGYRFVTSSCVDNGETLDIYYHYDKDLVLKQYKLNVAKGITIPSISKVFFCAMLVENEIKDLFGVQFSNLVLDYGGKLLLSDGAPDAPMACGGQIIVIEKGKE